MTFTTSIILALFYIIIFFIIVPGQAGTASSTVVQGQSKLITDSKSYTYTIASSTPTIATWTFPNGFTTTSLSYKSAISLNALGLSLGTSASSNVSISIGNFQSTSVDLTINFNPNLFTKVGAYLIVVDSTYSPYLFFSPQVISPNQNPLVSYTGQFMFSQTLISSLAPNLKLFQMLTGFDLNPLSPYHFEYNSAATIINKTHYLYSIGTGQLQNFVNIRICIMIIEVDYMPIQNIFLFINLNAIDGSTQSSANNSTFLYQAGLLGCTNYLFGTSTILDFSASLNTHTVIILYAYNIQKYNVDIILFVSGSCPTTPFIYYNDADSLCYDVCPPSYIPNTITMKCQFHIQFCESLSASTCLACLPTFVKAADSLSCYCPTGTTYLTGTCNTIANCVSALIQNGVLTCTFCDITKKLTIVNNQCQCMLGYYDISNSNGTNTVCAQVCGDGLVFTLACDDGNLNNGDGCSIVCTIQPNFICTIDASKKTICKSQQNINIQFNSIKKIDNQNSAIITFLIKNPTLPFPLILTPADVLITNPTNILSIGSLSQSGPYLSMLINYNQTIEGMNASFQFNFDNSLYITKNSVINFKMNSNDWPFLYADNIEALKMISYCSTTVGYVSTAILLFALPAPKFIGIQTVQIIQLIYFSTLLVNPISYWSPIYKVLTPLQYSNGYHINNLIGNYQTFDTSNPLYKKYFLLDFSNVFLNNNNLTILILFAMTSIFFVVQIKRQNAQGEFLALKKKQDNAQIKESFYSLVKLTEKAFKVCFHFCMFVMLNVFASIVIQTSVTLTNPLNQLQLISNKLVLIITIVIVILFLLNNYLNLLLMKLKLKKFTYRYQRKELTHVRANIIYLIIMGSAILCFNSVQIKEVPFSVVVLVLQIAYVVILIKINPYQYSIKIHRFAVVFNHVCLLIFLVFLNFNNIFHPSDLYQYLMCYFALTAAAVIFILAIIRLIFQYKYGNQLDDQVMKQDQQYQKAAKQKYQLQLRQKIQEFQRQAKRKAGQQINLNSLYLRSNIYLYENQVQEDAKYDLLKWLQTKINWSEEQRQQYYFKKFKEKPLKLLQCNNKLEYARKVQKLKKQQEKRQIANKNKQKQSNQQELLQKMRVQEWKSSLKQQLKQKKQLKKNKKLNYKKK